MTLRVSGASAKFANDTVGSGDLRAAGASAKFAIDSGTLADLRVAGASIKFAVRVFKIQRIITIVPPVPLTQICSCNPVCCFKYGV